MFLLHLVVLQLWQWSMTVFSSSAFCLRQSVAWKKLKDQVREPIQNDTLLTSLVYMRNSHWFACSNLDRFGSTWIAFSAYVESPDYFPSPFFLEPSVICFISPSSIAKVREQESITMQSMRSESRESSHKLIPDWNHSYICCRVIWSPPPTVWTQPSCVEALLQQDIPARFPMPDDCPSPISLLWCQTRPQNSWWDSVFPRDQISTGGSSDPHSQLH